jgi:hypothetical protein
MGGYFNEEQSNEGYKRATERLGNRNQETEKYQKDR